MSRYAKIIDGCNVTDIAENEGGYNYYLYTRPGGSGVIMRGNTAGTEFRFKLFGNGGANTQAQRLANILLVWNARADKIYVRSGECKSL